MARYLLDTHVLLWALSRPEHLSDEARTVIRDPRNQILVSTASVWEMAIKTSLGKLTTPDDLEDQLRINRFDVLPITYPHVRAAAFLLLLHRDPFDRMLVAQARHEGLRLITRDAHVQQYEVDWLLG